MGFEVEEMFPQKDWSDESHRRFRFAQREPIVCYIY